MKIPILPLSSLKNTLLALSGAAAFLVSGSLLQGQTDYTWVGSVDEWDDETAWTPAGGPPTPTDNVIMNDPGPMVNSTSFTMNNITIDGGSLFRQIAVGASGGPIEFNVNGNMTHTGTSSQLLFRGRAQDNNTTEVLSVNIAGDLNANGGGQFINFGEHRGDLRYAYALNGLSVGGTTSMSNGADIRIYTNGATATFGEVNMATIGGHNTLLLNNGSLTDDFGSQFPDSRRVEIAGLSGGTDGSQVSASGTDKTNGAVTLELTGSGTYEFFGRINNRTDNSISGSIVTVEKTGSGTQILSNSLDSGYSGNTTVSNGTLIVDGTLARTPLIEVAAGATFGGSGSASFGGAELQLNTDANLIFNLLSLVGDENFETFSIENVSFTGDGQFSLGNLVNVDGSSIDWESVAIGTYTLIDGNVQDFSQWVDDTVFDIGDGRTAQFQEGSLQLQVIPEPSTYAAILGFLALGLVWLRRRKG